MALLDHPVVARVDATAESIAELFRGRPAADRLMYALSELGDFSLIWHTLSVARATFGDDDAFRRSIRLSATLGVESILVNGLIKSLVRRERPSAIGVRPHPLRQPRTSSFPSGHASAAACAAVLLADDLEHPLPIYVLAALVATSRVHVGIHHGSDVLAGAIVGAAIGCAARHLVPLR